MASVCLVSFSVKQIEKIVEDKGSQNTKNITEVEKKGFFTTLEKSSPQKSQLRFRFPHPIMIEYLISIVPPQLTESLLNHMNSTYQRQIKYTLRSMRKFPQESLLALQLFSHFVFPQNEIMGVARHFQAKLHSKNKLHEE